MKGTKLEEGPGAFTEGILRRAGVGTVPRVWEGALEGRLRLQLLLLWQSESHETEADNAQIQLPPRDQPPSLPMIIHL